MNQKKRMKSSIFVKIILVFLSAHLTIALVGYSVHKYHRYQYHTQVITKNLIHYSQFLSAEIGSPPDTVRARSISKKYPVQIRLSSPGLNWRSAVNLPPFSLNAAGKTDITEQLKSGMRDDRFFVEIARPDIHLLFIYNTDIQKEAAEMQWRILIMVLAMMTILTIIYFVIRFILRPLKVLDMAVNELGSGNLDYQMRTERRDELGDLIRSFNDMAGRLKKMVKARDQLLLDVSHELRSPLTRIKVALEFLDDSAAKETIRDDIGEMENMLTELLESERLNSVYGGLRLQSVHLNDLIAKVCTAYDTGKPGLHFTQSVRNAVIQADPERLKIALTNILRNAQKYSAFKGKPVEVTLSEDKEQFILKIRDFGPGIPQKDLPFIFEPFYRVDKSRSKKTGGYGLGLSLSKKIIGSHGAKIEVESALNEGTVFYIKFKKHS